MDGFTGIIAIVGRATPTSVVLLGTAFLISNDGRYVTSRHVIGDDPNGIVILEPHIQRFNDYQDVANTQCVYSVATVSEIDPIRDLAILKLNTQFISPLPEIASIDEVIIGERVEIYGYPHCTDARRVLTYQSTEIGAKILLESNGIKNKHAVLNIQSRPSQSGSMVFSRRLKKVIGVLIGTYAPQDGMMIGNINPAELNQTTHIISAEYIKGML